MRFRAVFIKSLREQWRAPLVLFLTLIFAPLIVYLYSLFFPNEGSTSYSVILLNHDTGTTLNNQSFQAVDGIRSALEDVTYANGSPLIRIKEAYSFNDVEEMLRERKALVYISIPEGFSQTLVDARRGVIESPAEITFGGDLTNPYYAVAAVLATSAVDAYIQQESGIAWPASYVEEPLGGSGTRSEFEIYVPGILIFASIMLVFTAAMTIAREVEAGTLKRLAISRMRAFDLLGGTSLTLVLVGLLAMLLTLLTALAIGFHSNGPLWLVVLVVLICNLSIVGVGMLIAAFSKTVAQAFIIANFPLGIFIFFSGAMFPMPSDKLFEIGGRGFGLCSLIPARHAVDALNKVMTLGLGFKGVLFELAMLAALSLLTFMIGVWLFQKRQMHTC